MRKRIVASIKFTRYLFICCTSSGNKYYMKASQSKDWNEQKYNHTHKYKSILNLRIIKYNHMLQWRDNKNNIKHKLQHLMKLQSLFQEKRIRHDSVHFTQLLLTFQYKI